MSSDDKILKLTQDVLTPAFAEVAASPALNRRFTVRTEDVTRAQVLNHLLSSFDFYKMTAFSAERPW